MALVDANADPPTNVTDPTSHVRSEIGLDSDKQRRLATNNNTTEQTTPSGKEQPLTRTELVGSQASPTINIAHCNADWYLPTPGGPITIKVIFKFREESVSHRPLVYSS